jgi:NTP pyrophosphatase (non-canonical NTP hydrolase)
MFDININTFKSLNAWSKLAYQEAKNRGFHSSTETEEIKVGDFTSNLHSEISEFWEAYREGKLHSLCDKAAAMVKHGLEPLTCAEEELADVIIRVLDTAAAFKIDLAKAVCYKMLFNRTRSHRNGGKLA